MKQPQTVFFFYLGWIDTLVNPTKFENTVKQKYIYYA